MAERLLLFFGPEGFASEIETGDTTTVGGLTIEAGGDVAVSSGGEVTGLPAIPSGDTAAASKAYVDSVAQGLDVHESVRVATTAAGTLASSFANGEEIDGVTLATGDRILIQNQADPSENGIYVVNATGAPTRADDWDTGYEAAGAFCFVEEGTANADSGFVCTSNDSADTTGTHDLTFSQFSGAGQVTAGAGLTKSGNTINVGAGDGITVNADDVDVLADILSTTTTEANAIIVAANGVSIKVDDSTIEGSGQGSAGAEALRIKAGGITGSHLAGDITFTTTGDITANAFTGDGSGLTNLPSAATTDAVVISALKSTAGTITAGKVVHLVGYSSPNYTVELADADTAALMPAIGIVTSTVTDSVAGSITISGRAQGLDTSSWSAGDGLYISTTAGELTATRPTGATTLIQRLGEVAVSHASTGVIQVTGAGRSNDVPNMAENHAWVADSTGVAQETEIGDGLTVTPGTRIDVELAALPGLEMTGTSPDKLLKAKVDGTTIQINGTSGALEAIGAADAEKIENTFEAATGGVTAGDPVYFSANDTVDDSDAANANAWSTVGVALTTEIAGADVQIVSQGPAPGAIAGATAGDLYYLASGGGLTTTRPTGSGNRLILMGVAQNATTLYVMVQSLGRLK